MSESAGRRRSGQTILELVACLIIVAVTTAIAFPRYAAWRDVVAAREAASELAGALSFARETAVLRAGFISVVLDVRQGSAVLNVAGGTVSSHDLGARYGVTLAANRDSVVYDPRGLGYGASNVTIVVRRGTAAETVTVSRMGRIRW
jgi:Tfp pilus assembly protein FimT